MITVAGLKCYTEAEAGMPCPQKGRDERPCIFIPGIDGTPHVMACCLGCLVHCSCKDEIEVQRQAPSA